MATIGADVGPAVRALDHRGVRGRVVADCGKGVSLGHVRLPIVGLGEEYDQPMVRDHWTVAFVGEILDYKTWAPELACDAPLVAATWLNVQFRGFQKFDGFWSVVAVDGARGVVHALCDYLAQKPLYYRSDRHVTAVASEPDAVAALGPVTPDEVYFSSVVKWGYCPETWRTPYREIHKMRPGEYLKLERYCPPVRAIVDPLMPRRGTPAELLAAIERAARLRTYHSDVPVAALVSGGLDSAITYTLARRYGGVRPYHVENGEADAARVVIGGDWGATTLVDPRAIYPSPREDPARRALRYMQEPLDLGSLVPQTELSDCIAAAGGERVCLTGDGADELFGGYGRAARYDSQWSDVFHELVGYHLPRLDRVMMRNRVEVRSPFLSRHVVELALGLPREARTDKKILRDLFRPDLPGSVADQVKRPLRTAAVAADREGQSRALVEKFRAEKWPEGAR